MRVLMLSWEYPPLVYGGLGRHVHALAEAEVAAGHEVTVVTQAIAGAPADSVVNGVRVVRVPSDEPARPMSELLAWVAAFDRALTRAALAVARAWPPDVVHAHDWVVAHTAAALRRQSIGPVVATVHATEAGRHQGWLPAPLNQSIHSVESWFANEAHRVITCSAHMRWEVNRLFGVADRDIQVIPNGMDVAAWTVAPVEVSRARRAYAPEGPLLVFTGRLEWEKGCHTLLDAMPELRRRHPRLRLVVAGHGSKAADLREHAEGLKLGRAVRFTGWLPDVELRALVAAADVAVAPSIYEPFGLVALEAAASDTPVVVSNTGGLRDIVDHGTTGLRFEPGDAEALADAVSSLLTNHDLSLRVRTHARAALARDYTWEQVASRTTLAYAEAQSRRARPQDRVGLDAPPVLPVKDGNLLR